MNANASMPAEAAVDVLQHLIRVSEDGSRGFAEAAEQVDDPNLKVALGMQAMACANARRELSQCVRSLGGQARVRGTVAGALYRRWLSLRAAVTDTRTTMLSEADRGAHYLVLAFEQAARRPLPRDAHTLVERQRAAVLRNGYRLTELRERFWSAA